MKVTINDNKKKHSIKFPCLIIHDDGDLVVLFKTGDEGTVVLASEGYKVGDASENWSIDEFITFNGSVTLEND